MANVYSPETLGIKPPAGGFKQGGWYSGRQYWAGTLSEPGAIHPQSDQPGAGQPVSPEVIAQTAPENVQYIEEQKGKAATAAYAPAATYAPGAPSPGVPTPGAPAPGAEMPGITTPETINLPELYKSLYESAGISKLEEEYSTKEKEFIEAKAKINDNPFLSEATRVGRIAKIESLFAERTANLQRDILTKKADVEMQLNLQTKQFDIESTAAQQALDRFNVLLSMGALDDASGEAIASLTRSTGIPSTMIYSAIKASKAKNIQTSVVTWSDGTNDYFVTTDQYGNIVNRTLIGPTAKEPRIGTATERYQATIRDSAIADLQAGITSEDFARKYGGSLDDWELMSLYNQYSIYGPMTESPKMFKEWTEGKREEEPELWETKQAVQQEVHNAMMMGASDEEIENYIRSQGFDPYDFDY